MRRMPAYRVHKTKNLAYVYMCGRMHYLGRAHSPESWQAYHAAIASHLKGKPPEKRSRTRGAVAAFTPERQQSLLQASAQIRATPLYPCAS